jgi:hypothetical protein
VGSVKAETYDNLYIQVYRDGNSVGSPVRVLNGNPFLISGDTDDVHFEVDLYYSDDTAGNINSLVLMPYRTVSISDDTYVMKAKGQVAEWLYTRYELPKKRMVRSAYVSTQVPESETPQIRITPYPTGTEQVIQVTPYKEEYIDIPACGSFEFNVKHYTDGVWALADCDDVIVHLEKHVPIENRHTILRDIGPTEGIRNRVFQFEDTGCFCAVRVVADNYDTAIRVTPYADDVEQQWIDVDSSELFDLFQDMPNAKKWRIDIDSNSTIREIMLLTKETTPYDGKSWVVRRDSVPWSWRHHRLLAPKPIQFTCARVIADIYPLTLNIYGKDEALLYSYAVTSNKHFRLIREQAARHWRIDVTGAPDSQIDEVALSTSTGGLG